MSTDESPENTSNLIDWRGIDLRQPAPSTKRAGALAKEVVSYSTCCLLQIAANGTCRGLTLETPVKRLVMWEVVVRITANALRLPKWHSTSSFLLPVFTTSCNNVEAPTEGRRS